MPPAKPKHRILELRFVDQNGDAIRNKTGVIDWGTETGIVIQTDSNGLLVAAGGSDPPSVPVTPNQGTISLDVWKNASIKFDVFFAGTNDAGTAVGARARLSNLGSMFATGDPSAFPTAADNDLNLGIAFFKQGNGTFFQTPVTLDPTTKDRLTDAADKGGPIHKR